MGTKYFAFYENLEYVEKDKIESIANFKGYKFIIKREEIENHDFRWSCIDENEIEKTIIDRDFECIDFGIKRYSAGFTYINCKIRDLKKQTLHDLKIDPFNVDSVKDVLLPALDKMNELGSWENFEILRQNKELKAENEKLTKEKDNLTKRISELESANK